jgi:hypothetical protein
MCNTDSGTIVYDDLYRLLNISEHVSFSEKNIRALTWDNAFQFYNLKLAREF